MKWFHNIPLSQEKIPGKFIFQEIPSYNELPDTQFKIEEIPDYNRDNTSVAPPPSSFIKEKSLSPTEEENILNEAFETIPEGFESYKDMLNLDPFSFPKKHSKLSPEQKEQIQKVDQYFNQKIENLLEKYNNHYRIKKIANEFKRYWRKTSPQEKIYRFQIPYNFMNFKGIYPTVFRGINFVNQKGEIQVTPEHIQKLTEMSPSRSVLFIDRSNFESYAFENGKFVKAFPNSVGKMSALFEDKIKEGDKTTPIGIYDIENVRYSSTLSTTGVFIDYPTQGHKNMAENLFGAAYRAGGGVALHKPKFFYDLYNPEEIHFRSISCIHIPARRDTIRYVTKEFPLPSKNIKKENPESSYGGIIIILPHIDTNMYEYDKNFAVH